MSKFPAISIPKHLEDIALELSTFDYTEARKIGEPQIFVAKDGVRYLPHTIEVLEEVAAARFFGTDEEFEKELADEVGEKLQITFAASWQDELDEVYAEYQKETNMGHQELLEWKKHPCSSKASIGRTAINRNIRLKSKNKSEWNSWEVTNAKKAIAYLARAKKQTGGESFEIEDGGEKYTCPARRVIALKNWAFDPTK